MLRSEIDSLSLLSKRMNKRNKLSKEQQALKQRILAAYQRRNGFAYIPMNWDDKLWKKSTSDIHDYIQTRFDKTLDVVEYYSAIVFLWKTMPATELLVEFHDSPQWAEVARTYHTDQPKAPNRNEQNTTHVADTQGNHIEMPHKTTFDGEI